MKRISYVLSLKVVTFFFYIYLNLINEGFGGENRKFLPRRPLPLTPCISLNAGWYQRRRLISSCDELPGFVRQAEIYESQSISAVREYHRFNFSCPSQWQTRRVVPNPVSRGVIGQDPPLILIQDESKHLPPSLFGYHHQSKPGGLNITSLHPLYTFNKSIFSSFSSFLITVLVSSCLFLPRPFHQRLLYFCNQYLRLEKHLLRTNPSPWHQASSSLLLLILRCLIVANVFSRKTDANKPVGPKYGPGPNFGPGSFTL